MVESLSNAIEVQHESYSVTSQVFLVLQLIGFTCTLFTFIAAILSSKKRHLTWYNFMASWVLYCLSYLLLFMSGQANNLNPPFALCLVQSAMVHTTAPYASSTTLGLIVQLFLNVQSAIRGRALRYQKFGEIFILIVPYLVVSSLMLYSVVLGLVTPRQDLHFKVAAFQCTANSIIPGRLAAGLTVSFVISLLIINAVVYYRLRKHWSILQLSGPTWHSTSMIIRASLFSVFGVLAVIAGLIFFFVVFIHRSDTPKALTYHALNLILALFPIAVIIIFGTHSDLLGILIFWRKKRQTTVMSAASTNRMTMTITHSVNSSAEPTFEFVCMGDVPPVVATNYEKELSEDSDLQKNDLEPESQSRSSFSIIGDYYMRE